MERELMVTGIGGQGVQLAAQLLALGAIAEGRQVQLFGSYGGMMRGGATEATVIVADGPVVAPPTVSRIWSAIVMHHEHWAPTRDRLRAGSVVLVNSTVFSEALGRDDLLVVEVPATEISTTVDGSPLNASMVMAGAYAAATGLASIEAVVSVIDEALPAYRRQHRERIEAALRAGHDAGPAGIAPAWGPVAA
jgi:2-oxoglutarate ferredoxin oxidoreductase subunit gamma